MLTEIAVSVPMILTVGAFVGLVEVELAYALLARDEGRRSPRSSRAPRRREESSPDYRVIASAKLSKLST